MPVWLMLLIGLLIGFQEVQGALDSPAMDPYILRVLTRREGGGQPVSGTGFLIQDAHVLITNYHVVDGAKEILVLTSRKKEELLPARVVKVSKAHDIAILSVEGLPDSGLLLSPREEVVKGQQVWAIGYPGAADRGRVDINTGEASLTRGIVNRTLYQPWEEGGPVLSLIQHDAKLSHGNSGGPLLDECGYVVGINTQIELAEQALETYNYALSVMELRSLLDGWGIGYRNAEVACTVVAKPTEERLIWWSVGLSVLMACAALILALGGPRHGLGRAVAKYSSHRRQSRLSKSMQTDTRVVGVTTDATASLTLRKGNGTVCLLRCPASQSRQWTLGRNAALCDQVIDDDTVSRSHARLLWQPQSSRWYVEDLNSSNGTWLDGRALEAYEPVALYHGALLTLGQLQLAVAVEDPGKP